MKTGKGLGLLLLILTMLFSVAITSYADDMIRGLVVDRSDNILWLGLPASVQKGTVFNVMLVPGDTVIARAEVLESTLDSPFVAKARFVMVDQNAFVPVGAYVEITDNVISDVDDVQGYKPIEFGPEEPNPLSFQAGIFFPTDSDLKDETDWGWPYVQLNYRTTRSERSEVNVGVGYYRQNGDFTVDDVPGSRDLWALPVTVDVKIRKALVGWFWRLGVGAYIINDDRTVGGVSDDDTVTTFGWLAGFGYESQSGRLVQVHYVDASSSDFKGAALSFGARF